ncbi:MAG: transporter [Dehalococcoidia bacterium]|nr:transporter [Dehalococcoidia bacterium]
MSSRLLALIVKEFLQVRRDRRTLGMMLVMPVVQLLLFAYAVNTTVDHMSAVVNDQARDVDSRRLIDAIVNTTYFDIVRQVTSAAEAQRMIDAGEAKAAFIIAPDFARNLQIGRSAHVQVLIDGSDPNVAQAALFASDTLGRVLAAQQQQETIQSRGIAVGGGGLAVEFRPTVLYNPSMASVNFMVPGLIGLILQLQTMILTSFAIVRERERGTLEQLIVTPIKRWELMLGKVLPFVIVAFWNVGVTLVVGVFWFGVPINGSVLLLLTLSVLFLLGSLGIGLLISTVSRTQGQALQSAFFIMMPMFILSGFVFPLEAMPRVISFISYAIPLTYFLRILRGIVLKGVGLEHLWIHVIPLAILSLVVFAISVNRFRKTLE